jgi:hypothetical protein
VLENLLRTIHREHARYVGVVATDVEDLIFLVHEIRSNCPNVVVFTTSANLLFAHTDATSELSGMLVFSTYPLFNELQPWTDSNDVENQLRIQFPSEDAEGIYHATLAQLGVKACRPPCTSRLPDLWLSVVGRGGLWPIKVYAADGEAIGTFPDSPRELGAKMAALFPPAFQLAFLFTSVVCLLTCLAIISQSLFNAGVMQMEGPLAPNLIGDSIFPDLRPERRKQAAALAGAMFIIQLVGLLLYLLPFGVISIPSGNCSIAELLSSPLWLVGLQLLIGGIALDVALVAFIMAIKALRAPVLLTKSELGAARNFRVSPTGAPLSIIRLCFTGVLTYLLVLEFCWLSPQLRMIYFMRAANLGNGVSPIMPLIFLAFASLTQTGGRLWRLRILEERRFTLPFLNFDRGAESFRGTGRLEEDVVKTLECAPSNLAGWWPLLIFLIGIFSYYAMTGLNIHPLDHSVFDRFISFPMPSAFQLLAFVSGFFIYLFFATQLLRFVLGCTSPASAASVLASQSPYLLWAATGQGWEGEASGVQLQFVDD